MPDIYLLRHGETEWSLSGRHTGVSDIPLTEHGEEEARRSGERLRGVRFAKILTSPRVRARRTLELAGFGAHAEVLDDLREWTYGEYEGLLPTEIRARHPGWNVFEHGCPGGETPAEVSERADRVLALVKNTDGPVLLVSHGHFTRALAVRWVKLPIQTGGALDSSTASLSILSASKNTGANVLRLWNWTPSPVPAETARARAASGHSA